MKICFLAHNVKQDNGAGVFSLRLIEGMRHALGADVIALTSEPSGLSFERSLLRRGFLRNFFSIRRILKECDVVHALDAYPYGVIAALALLGIKKKLIITAIGTGAIHHLYKPFYGLLLRFAYKKADAVTTVSNFSKNAILKKIPNLSIIVITHGVDFDDWQGADTSSPEMLQRVQRFKPYIISVGALRARKGYNLSIRSFAKVKKYFPDLKYIIVGKRYGNHFYQKLKTLIGDLHLENDVFIVEDVHTRNDLAAWYTHAALFCLLSRSIDNDFEAFGLVFLEAAACGLPVVGTTEGGVLDAVKDGENGLLADVSDVKPFYTDEIDPFAKAIITVLSDGALQERMKQASIAFAKSSGWKEKMTVYQEIYRKLLLTKSQPR